MENPQSLYNLANIFADLRNRDDLNPEILQDTLDSISASIGDKADNIASWMEQLQKDVDFDAKKIKIMQQDKRSKENKIKSLNDYLVSSIDQAGIKNLRTEKYHISARNYRASTIVEDVNKLSPDYVETVTTYKPDKTKIYQKLKAGEDVPGARLVPNRKAVIK